MPQQPLDHLHIDTLARASIVTSTRSISGSTISGDFDVFLCYNREDISDVKNIGAELRLRGVIPWLDEWELPPGKPWQFLLEQQIEKINSAGEPAIAETIHYFSLPGTTCDIWVISSVLQVDK